MLKKALCNFKPQIRLEIITSCDAKSACCEGSKTACDVMISGVFLWALWPRKIASRDGCILLITPLQRHPNLIALHPPTWIDLHQCNSKRSARACKLPRQSVHTTSRTAPSPVRQGLGRVCDTQMWCQNCLVMIVDGQKFCWHYYCPNFTTFFTVSKDMCHLEPTLGAFSHNMWCMNSGWESGRLRLWKHLLAKHYPIKWSTPPAEHPRMKKRQWPTKTRMMTMEHSSRGA